MPLRQVVRRIAFLALIACSVPATAQSARDVADKTIAKARAAMMIDPHVAQSQARLAQSQIDLVTDPAVRGTLRATALWLDGEAAYRLKDIDAAVPMVTKALILARLYAPGSKLEGDVLLSSGSMHGDTGKIVAALSEFQRAHTIFLRLNDPRNRAIALICIASLYSDGKDYVSALKYFDQALGVFDGDPGLSLSIQNNRAAVLRDVGRYAEAERGFRVALAMARTMHSRVLEIQILRNVARSQLKRNDLAGANETISEAKAITGEGDGFNQQALLGVAAQAAFQEGRIKVAAALLDRGFAGVDLAATPLTFHDAHATAYQVFSAIGRNDKALVHLLALKRLDDETARLATSTGAALMAARFDFANQELRIARFKADDLQRRIASERDKAASQRYIFFASAAATAIVIAALLAGLIVIRRSRDRVRAANDDLGIANGALGKALAAKTEFLATTSHEIRTPLNGILGMTQVMLADPALPPATRERLSVVHGAGTTMRALVDDILDVAKMETGKLTLETAPFDLSATILDATRLWEAQAAAKGVSFVRALGDCPQLVSGDGARVRQIVFNLLSNALKFTLNGEIGISVRPEADGRVSIAVRDTGIGIAADKLDAIFESFRQADAGTTRQFGGTGLGLAICRQLARAMGGDVGVASEVGRGSIFTVTLPLPGAEAAAQTPVVVDASAPALLVVDRNPITRSLFRTLLSPHAKRIVFAADAGEALAALAQGGIVHVLIDEMTVRATGDHHAALRSIVREAGEETRVVLLWPAAEDAERAALIDTGIACIVAKPVSGPSLVATLFRESNDPLVRRAA